MNKLPSNLRIRYTIRSNNFYIKGKLNTNYTLKKILDLNHIETNYYKRYHNKYILDMMNTNNDVFLRFPDFIFEASLIRKENIKINNIL